MALTVGQLVAYISADARGFRRGTREARRDMAGLQRDANGRLRDLRGRFVREGREAGEGFGGGILSAAKKVVKLSISTAAAAAEAAALAGAGVAVGVAFAPVLGIAAALPAAFAASKAAALGLKLALTGVGDALGAATEGDTEKLKEGLEALPKPARTVVGEIARSFFGLRKRVQSAFFRPLAKESKGLGKQLYGPVQGGLSKVGGALGGVARGVLQVARSRRSISTLRGLFTGTAGAIKATGPGVKRLTIGIRDMVRAFTGDLPKGGAALGRVLGRVGMWLSKIARSGQAKGWFRDAVDTLKQLGRIGGDVAVTVGNIFSHADDDAGDLLGSIEGITQKMADWSASAEGQDQIATTFGLLRDVLDSLSVILPLVVGPLGAVASVLSDMSPETRENVSQMLAWALVLNMIGGKLVAVGKGALDLGRKLVNPEGRFRKLAGAAASGGKRIAVAMANAGRAAAGAAVKMSRAALGFVASCARMAGAAMATALNVAKSWLIMGTQAMIQAARMAIAWVIANWPIALVIAVVIAAVALIIKHWDKVAAFVTKTLPAAIKRGMTWIVNAIKWAARVGFLGPVGLIIAHWGKIKVFFTSTLPNAVRNGANKAINWVKALPGRVKAGLGSAGKLLVSAGKDIVRGLWNGLSSMGGWLKSQITGWAKRVIPGPIARALGIASPSKVTKKQGVWIARGLEAGLTAGETRLKNTSKRLAGIIKAAFKGKKTSADDRLLGKLKWVNGRLSFLMKKRAAILAKAAEVRKDLASKARESASLSSMDFGDAPVTAGGIRDRMAGKLNQIRAFAQNIKTLAKRGLPRGLMQQILEAGPDAGSAWASALAHADGATFASIKGIQGQIDSASAELGRLGGSVLFGGDYRKTQAQIDRLGAAFARSAAKTLGVKKQVLEIRISGGTAAQRRDLRKNVRTAGGTKAVFG